MKTWTLIDGIALARVIENIAPLYGCHVALTGSVLYGDGAEKKDLDFILYRIRQVPAIDFNGLWDALSLVGIHKQSGFGFCYKATYQGKKIDFLCPEEKAGNPYPEEEPKDPIGVALMNRDSD